MTSPFAPAQADFAAALLDPERATPEALAPAGGLHPHRRFAVYRNNVVVSLVEALRARFPAVVSAVGNEFFDAMARAFAVERPPRSPVLMTFGDEFPDYIAAFPPAAEIAYLADLARIDAARTRAYHAADADPLDPSTLSAIDPDELGRARLTLHPSAEIVRSAHPIVTIWGMNSGEIEPAPIADWQAEDALVARLASDVEVGRMPPGGAAFIAALAADTTLLAAAQAGASDDPRFDLTANLAAMLARGLVISVHFPD